MQNSKKYTARKIVTEESATNSDYIKHIKLTMLYDLSTELVERGDRFSINVEFSECALEPNEIYQYDANAIAIEMVVVLLSP